MIYADIDQLVTTTHDTVNKLMWYKNWWDALILYFRYIQQRKQQQNNQTQSSTRFMREATGWWQDRFTAAKKILLQNWFIEDIVKKDESWKIIWRYVKVNFVISVSESGTCVPENHTVESPVSGEQVQNTLVTKLNTLVTKENNVEFEKIWKAYPHFRTWNKKDAEKIFKSHSMSVDEILNEIKILKRKNFTWISDVKYNPQFFRRLRDLAPTNQNLLEDILTKVIDIMRSKRDFPKNQELVADFPNVDVKGIFNKNKKNDPLTESMKKMLAE